MHYAICLYPEYFAKTVALTLITVRVVANGLYCFCRSYFLSVDMYDNSRSAARMQLDELLREHVGYCGNRTNSIDFENHGSKVKVTRPNFRIFHHCEIGKKACGYDNSCTAGLSLMKFGMNMYLDNLWNPTEFQGHHHHRHHHHRGLESTYKFIYSKDKGPKPLTCHKTVKY